MATSNRDRIGQMFEALGPALNAFLTDQIELPSGKSWVDVYLAVEGNNGMDVEPGDPSVQLKFVANDYTHRFKRGWRPLKGTLSRTHEAYASELLSVRNAWAHMKSFPDDDAYRALDTAERFLGALDAPAAVDAVARIRRDLRRVTADKDDKRTLKAAAVTPESAGLRPWREVLPPHDDVATGNFHASEFAADLYKVATGDAEQSRDYADPVEFFRRTYLTVGLRDLVGRAVRRLAGDDNASPVINLQTNFGGGKTHSMLSLWHVAGGTSLGDYPQDMQDLLTEHGFDEGIRVNRVALVGNHISPNPEPKLDGTQVNTLWGELAWQLGDREGYEYVARADASCTPPGGALHELLAAYSPAVILIDEWVAYARSLVGRDDLPAGTFDDQFTFAQSLTEAVKGTPGVLVAISIPASEAGLEGHEVAGNAEEVGGANGLEALKRLQRVVGRVADQWRPASHEEAYHIVRQRLFTTPDAEALAAIGATAKGFVGLYRNHGDDFPRESRDAAYEDRIKRTYPIHPELFDRLYEDWASLERFQRTRGVLRLMNTVIHALWVGEDASPLIMPGSIPLATRGVNDEIAAYLPDQWKSVIDADVDGPGSEPARIDNEKPLFGQRSVTKRLARTVFFGAVPTIGGAQKGLERQRVFLGTAMPGDQPNNFLNALATLGDRATYFYAGSGKYWYDLQANITRRAKDQAERLHVEDAWEEIRTRLLGQAKTRGAFTAVHVCPESHGDIPDGDEVRFVVLHPKVSHKRGTQSEAVAWARLATEHKGSASRVHRNQVVFLAADADRLAELETSVRDYLAWSQVLGDADELDLTQNQKNQATARRQQAHETTESRLLQTFVWALVPAQPDPTQPFTIEALKVEGQSTSLAERVSRRLGNDGNLAVQQVAALVRNTIGIVPRIWSDGHVSVGELWKLYATYPYMPRLRDRSVLAEGLVQQSLAWQVDGFALATSYDGERYTGLWMYGDDGDPPAITDSVLLVQPAVALAQRERERPLPPTPRDPDDPVLPPVSPLPPDLRPRPKVDHFFGSKTLNPVRYGVDFKNIADEILAHLAREGVELKVTVEIEAVSADGFDESQVRTVRENAATLRFDTHGFETEA